MFGIEYNLIGDHVIPTADDTVKDQHYTLLFQTFCLMNIVNMLNCRVIATPENKQYNVFVRIHHNWLFPIIVLFELNFQFAITYYPWLRIFFGCTPLSFNMQLVSGCLALGCLAVEALAKLTSPEFCNSLPAIPEGRKDDLVNSLRSISTYLNDADHVDKDHNHDAGRNIQFEPDTD